MYFWLLLQIYPTGFVVQGHKYRCLIKMLILEEYNS